MEAEKIDTKPNYLFLQGQGEMSRLVRAYDWASSPVGDPATWQHSLRTMVEVLLASKFPMLLLWGPQHIQIYNDAYRPVMGENGKHPTALGLPAQQSFPEIWDLVYGRIKYVYDTGEGTWSEDFLTPIFRNGRLEDVYMTCSYAPVPGDTGIIEGILVVCQETTKKIEKEASLSKSVEEKTQELEEAQQELEHKVLELQQSNKNLEEFAYAASHDLKEPVRKISFFANILKTNLGDTLSDRNRDFFDRMLGASEKAKALIDDLLTYSQANFIVGSNDTTALSVLVDDVLTDLDLQIEQKGAIITRNLPSVSVTGNKRQLQQVLGNLLSNALKYNRPGTAPLINITCSTIPAAELQHGWEHKAAQYHLISVTDNGIGFEQEYAEKIFSLFTRLHGNAEYTGSGIGLAIVRKIVENHDGYIAATGEPGKGATFSVYLPVVDGL